MGRRARLILLAVGSTALVFGFEVVKLLVEPEAFEPADFALEIVERALLVGAMVAVAWTTVGLHGLRADHEVMRQDLARAVALGEAWRTGASAEIETFSSAIRKEFDAWSLSPAEADIAGLLMKGVSVRDIARLRGTSETTIRQQAQAVYRKSGLSGRAELAAYFLDSLFDARTAVPEMRAN